MPYRGLTNSQESINRSSVSAIPPHLSSAPPAYEDVVSQGTGRKEFVKQYSLENFDQYDKATVHSIRIVKIKNDNVI